jgi:hypothetical protein
MEIAHQLQQVGILLAQDGFITVLEKMAAPSVATVEAHRVSSEQAPHDNRYRYIPGSEQQVEMVRQECPGVTGGSGLAENWSESVEKILPIRVITINASAFNPTTDNMMQRSGSIDAGFTRHGRILLYFN